MLGKNTPKREDLKEGVVLIYEDRRGDYHTVDTWCKVAKVTPKGWVTVTWKSYDKVHEKVIKPDYRALRVPTEHELAMRAWKKSAPKTEILRVSRDGGWRGDREEFHVELDLRTGDDLPAGFKTFSEVLAKVRVDMAVFEKWYATRPQPASPAEDDE